MTIYIVVDMKGGFVKAFFKEEDARKYVMKQPGKWNYYDVEEAEVE